MQGTVKFPLFIVAADHPTNVMRYKPAFIFFESDGVVHKTMCAFRTKASAIKWRNDGEPSSAILEYISNKLFCSDLRGFNQEAGFTHVTLDPELRPLDSRLPTSQQREARPGIVYPIEFFLEWEERKHNLGDGGSD